MQSILNGWCKRVLGVKLSNPNAAVAGELGQYPLIVFRKIQMLKYWTKIVSGPRDRYRNVMYQNLKNNVDSNAYAQYKNWALEIRRILIEIGMEGLWHSEHLETSAEQFIAKARCILVDLYITVWRLDMAEKEKLQTHNLYKVTFQHELYLSNIKSVKLRVAMTRLRLSSHNLAIETGRYHPRTVRHHRYCRQCDRLDIEDEYHFMCKCIKHKDVVF